jgi:hypothetical protein
MIPFFTSSVNFGFTWLTQGHQQSAKQKGHLQIRSNTIIPFNGFAHQSDRTRQVAVVPRCLGKYSSTCCPGFLVLIFLPYDIKDFAASRKIRAVAAVDISRGGNNARDGEHTIFGLMPELKSSRYCSAARGWLPSKSAITALTQSTRNSSVRMLLERSCKSASASRAFACRRPPRSTADHGGHGGHSSTSKRESVLVYQYLAGIFNRLLPLTSAEKHITQTAKAQVFLGYGLLL